MLPRDYQFQVKNETGQTIAASKITIRARRWKFDSNGAVEYESSETAVFDFASTLADDAYAEGSAVDNSVNLFIGGDFEFEVEAPASSNGDVICYLQPSTDGATTYGTDGDNDVVAVLNFTTSGTKRTHFAL